MKSFTGICQKCGKVFSIKEGAYYARIRNNLGFNLCSTCLRWTEEQKERRKQTKLERYGSITYNNRQKAKETCLNKYGVDNVIKVDSIKNKRDLSKNWSKEVLQKRKETCLERYGVENTSQIPSVIKGREEYYKNPERKNKRLQKYKNTCKERYNVLNTFLLRIKNIPNGIFYRYDNKTFESSWELYFYIFLQDHKIAFIYKPKPSLKYLQNGEEHSYFPDFKINKTLIEIKGDLYIKQNILFNPYTKQFLKEKTECLKQNNVKILTRKNLNNVFNYIFNTYGRNYCKKFIKRRLDDEKSFCD